MIRPPIYLDKATTDLDKKQIDKLNQMIRFFYNRFISKSEARKLDYHLSNPLKARSGRLLSSIAYKYQDNVMINGQLVLNDLKFGNTYPLFELTEPPASTMEFTLSNTLDLTSDATSIGNVFYKDGVLYIKMLQDIENAEIYPFFSLKYKISTE